MELPRDIYCGVVKGQTSGLPVGPVEDMTYRINVNLPGGAREVPGIAPAVDRWDGIDCRALKPGTGVVVGTVLGRLQLLTPEIPDRRPCGPSDRSDEDRLVATIARMSPAQKEAIRKALAI